MLHKVDHFIKIVLLGLHQFLINCQNRNVSLRVTTGHPTPIFTPPKTIEGSWFLLNLLADYWCFDVLVDVPNINISLGITWGEDTWVGGTPLCIVDIFLSTFKCHYWWSARFRHPELHSPVHWTWEQHVRHVAVLLRLTNAWVDIDTSHWGIMPV